MQNADANEQLLSIPWGCRSCQYICDRQCVDRVWFGPACSRMQNVFTSRHVNRKKLGQGAKQFEELGLRIVQMDGDQSRKKLFARKSSVAWGLHIHNMSCSDSLNPRCPLNWWVSSHFPWQYLSSNMQCIKNKTTWHQSGLNSSLAYCYYVAYPMERLKKINKYI